MFEKEKEENETLRELNKMRMEESKNLRNKITDMKRESTELKKTVKRLQSKDHIKSLMEGLLKNIFTPKQIYKILTTSKSC